MRFPPFEKAVRWFQGHLSNGHSDAASKASGSAVKLGTSPTGNELLDRRFQIEQCQMARSMNTVISVSEREMQYSAGIQLFISIGARVVYPERSRKDNDKHADAVAMAGRLGFDISPEGRLIDD